MDIRAVRDDKGKILYYEGTTVDITERKRVEEKTIRQSAILYAINRVFEETLRCETDEEVAAVCLLVAQELSGSKFGWIGEVNADGHLDTIALSDPGWELCRIPQSQAIKMIRNMEIRGIWGRVLKDGKSLITNDPVSHPDSVGLPQGHPGLTAFMGVPLKYAGQTIGMIALANKPNGYDVHDQEAIETLSSAFTSRYYTQNCSCRA
jgi:GAF domain-containing protein